MSSANRSRPGDTGGTPVDGGAIVITLRHPAAAFLYRATGPRLCIDGSDVKLPGWGIHRVPLTEGRHQVRVWVPYAIPRRAGRARIEVTVAPRREVELEYVAPTVTLLRGSLGPPGRQRSAGWSGVMVFNVVAVGVVLVLLVVAFL